MATYATEQDVRLALGTLGNRLPDGFDVVGHLRMAHSEVLDRLSDAYAPGDVPTFTGPGLDVVRWTEARLAAANILDILRASTGTDNPAAAGLRESAYATLERGVPGFRPGSPVTTPDGTIPAPVVPLTSTVHAVTVFADPYAAPPDPFPFPADGTYYALP